MADIYTPTVEDAELFNSAQASFEDAQVNGTDFNQDPEDDLDALLQPADPETTAPEDDLDALLQPADTELPEQVKNIGIPLPGPINEGVKVGDLIFAADEIKNKGFIEGAKSIAETVKNKTWDLTVGKYQRGKAFEQRSLLYNKYIQTGDEQFLNEARAADKALMAETPVEADTLLGKIVGGAAEQAPQIPGRIAAAGKAAVDDGEVVTTDAGSQLDWGKKASNALLGGLAPVGRAAEAFMFDYNYEVMAGDSYAELDKIVDPKTGQGIPEEIKIKTAKIVGGLGAVIENADLVPLFRLIPGGAKAAEGLIQKGVKETLKSGAFKAMAGRFVQATAVQVGTEEAEQAIQWIANEVAKNTTNELIGTNMPPEDITLLGKRLKEAFMPTIYASIGMSAGFTTLGMSVETMAQMAGKQALKAEASYNLQRKKDQIQAETASAQAELDTLKTSFASEPSELALPDPIEDEVLVDASVDDLLAIDDIDALDAGIDEILLAPREAGSGYSLSEHRVVENSLSNARIARNAEAKTLEEYETTGRSEENISISNQALEKYDGQIEELSARATEMRASKRDAAVNAIISGSWNQIEEARTVAGKGTGVSQQEMADARKANADTFKTIKGWSKERRGLLDQRKALEESNREEGKTRRTSPELKAVDAKLKEVTSRIRQESKKALSEKDRLDSLEGRKDSKVVFKLAEVKTALNTATEEAYKGFSDDIKVVEAESVKTFRQAIRTAWAKTRQAVAAGNQQGIAAGKAEVRALIYKQRIKQRVFRLQQKLVGQIKRMVRTGSKRNGRTDADTQALFKLLRPLLNGKDTNVDRQAIEAAADNGDRTAHLQLQILAMRERAKNRDFSFLSALHDEVKAVYEGGKAAREMELDAVKARTEESIKKITKEIQGELGLRSRQEGLGFYIDNVANYMRFVGLDLVYAMRDIAAGIVQDSGTHFFDTEAYRVLETIDQEKARDDITRQYTEMVVSGWSSIKGIENSDVAVRADMQREALQPRENIEGFEFNITELRKLYMLLKTPDVRQHFIDDEGYTEEVLAAVEQKIESSPVDMKIVELQFDIMNNLYAKVDKVYSQLNGYHLPRREFYTHITRKYPGTEDVQETLADIMLGRDLSSASAETQSALKRYTGSKLPIRIVPDMLDTLDYVNQMAHYIAFAEKAREMSLVWKSPELAKELENKYGEKWGKKLRSKLVRRLDDTIRGRRADTNFKVDWIDTTLGFVVQITLAAKAKIMFGQMTSIVLYADQMNTTEFVAGMNEFLQDPVAAMEFLDANSTYFRNRSWRTDQALLKQMAEIRPGANEKYEMAKFWMAEGRNALMSNVVVGDKVSSYLGSYAMARALSKKMSVPAAIRKAEIWTRDTQQSAEMSVQSGIQAGGSIERLISAYSSQQLGMMRVQIRTMRDAYNAKGQYVRAKSMLEQGKGDVTAEDVTRLRLRSYAQMKAAAKNIAIFQIASPLLFAYVTSGFDWENDKMALALLGSITGVPVIGDAIEWGARKMLGLPQFGGENVLVQFSKDIIAAGDDLVQDREHIAQDVAVILQPVVQLPLKTIEGMLEGIGNAIFEGDIQKGVLRVLGYSEKTAEEAADN